MYPKTDICRPSQSSPTRIQIFRFCRIALLTKQRLFRRPKWKKEYHSQAEPWIFFWDLIFVKLLNFVNKINIRPENYCRPTLKLLNSDQMLHLSHIRKLMQKKYHSATETWKWFFNFINVKLMNLRIICTQQNGNSSCTLLADQNLNQWMGAKTSTLFHIQKISKYPPNKIWNIELVIARLSKNLWVQYPGNLKAGTLFNYFILRKTLI